MPVPKWITEIPIAHRGLHNGVDIHENTLESFDKAASKGYPIELDVQITRDDQIAVFHDFNLSRLAGREIKINQLSKTELKSCKILESDQHIPHIDEVFEAVNRRVPLLIEIKNFKLPGKLEAVLLNKIVEYDDDVAVQSFNPLSLLWLKKRFPMLPIGQLGSDLRNEDILFIKKGFSKYLFMKKAVNPDFIGYEICGLPNPSVNKIREKDKPVLSWTIKNKTDMERAKSYSDNFIFEHLLP
jgi:glycerophosphoryl diester phosphodiesterase